MIRSLVILALVLVPTVRASVRVVAPSGAPYTSIQTAVDASVDGDTILVEPGTYQGFTVQTKSLTIAADPEGSVSLDSIVDIRDITLTQRVVLSGFSIDNVATGALRATNCIGSLRLEAMLVPSFGPSMPHSPAIGLSQCDDVAILRCTLFGGDAIYATVNGAGSGLDAQGSHVAVYDSLIAGGTGEMDHYVSISFLIAGTPGAPACNLMSSTLFVSASLIVGGDGGAGTNGVCSPVPAPSTDGHEGGAGLSVGPGSTAISLDCVFAGGQGGNGGTSLSSCGIPGGAQGTSGPSVLGTMTTLPASSRRMSAPTLVRGLAPFVVSVTGHPGDLVWLQFGTTPTWSLDLAFSGVRLVSAVQRSTRIFIGALPASGMMTQTLVFPDLGPGLESRTNYMQALFRDASGVNVLGSGEVFTILDSAF